MQPDSDYRDLINYQNKQHPNTRRTSIIDVQQSLTLQQDQLPHPSNIVTLTRE